MNLRTRYNRLQMEYPELGWDELQRLIEKLGHEDRTLVVGLLNKIETLWVELERARVTLKSPTPVDARYFDFPMGQHVNCSCPVCVPEKQHTQTN